MTAALLLTTPIGKAEARPIAPRIDLRTGLVAAGALVAPPSLSALVREVRAARQAWRGAGFSAPLSVHLPDALIFEADVDWLSDAARECGCAPKGLTFELSEAACLAGGADVAEGLRARGWGVALIADPACPLPFGKHARALYTELIVDAPEPIDPYLAIDSCERDTLGRRLYAAKEAGLIITAPYVRTDEAASLLAIAGFDRCGGPVAAQP